MCTKGEKRMIRIKTKRIAFKKLTGFSHFPLRLASLLAFALADLSGFSVMAVILLRLLREHLLPESQAFTLVALLFLFGAVQLISLGIIGQTIGRVYDTARSGSPQSGWAARPMHEQIPSAKKPYGYD